MKVYGGDRARECLTKNVRQTDRARVHVYSREKKKLKGNKIQNF